MAQLRSVFDFRVNDLLVAKSVLGSKLQFRRDGYDVELYIPANAAEFGDGFDSLELRLGGLEDAEPRVARVRVSIVVGVSSKPSVDDALQQLKKTFQVADAVAREFLDWTRSRGQAWLGLHGQEPDLVVGQIYFDKERIPASFGNALVVVMRSREAAIDSTFWEGLCATSLPNGLPQSEHLRPPVLTAF